MSGRPPARRRKSVAARLRPFWLPIALTVLLFSIAAGFSLTWSGFGPKNVLVTGNRIVPRDEILARASVERNVNMWLQNTGAMARRVEAIPYVESVGVFRLPPATLLVHVRERKPFATVDAGGETVVVDRDMRVLTLGTGDPSLPRFILPALPPPLPGEFLREPQAIGLRDDYNALIAAHVVALVLEYDRYDGLVATVRGGVRLLLGSDGDLDAKLPLIDPILAQVVRKQRRVAAVDLRAPRTPVIVFK